MMLVFVDESGIPHPNDETIKPVLAAVCLPESQYRKIDTKLFSMKQKFLGNPDRELKAKKLLRPYVFENSAPYKELVESVFDMIRETEGLVIYAYITEKHSRLPEFPEGHLPIQFRRLLERIHLHCVEHCDPQDMAIIIYDGDGRGGIKGGLSSAINAFLIRSKEGIGMQRIITTPFFVNSTITPGIQLADLVAGCIRLYEERDTNRKMDSSGTLSSAIFRYYKIIESRTNNFDFDWATLYGLNFISERFLYEGDKLNNKTGEQA